MFFESFFMSLRSKSDANLYEYFISISNIPMNNNESHELKNEVRDVSIKSIPKMIEILLIKFKL